MVGNGFYSSICSLLDHKVSFCLLQLRNWCNGCHCGLPLYRISVSTV